MSFFASSYEVSTTYFLRAVELLEAVNSLPSPGQMDKEPEIKFSKWCLDNNLIIPCVEILDTMTFFRYRRNAFIHLHKSPHQKFGEFVSRKGRILNNYWGSSRESLDFSRASVEALTEDECRIYLKLIRICIQMLDSKISNALDDNGIARYLIDHEYGNNHGKVNSIVIEDRSRKIASIMKRQYGFVVSDSIIKDELKQSV